MGRRLPRASVEGERGMGDCMEGVDGAVSMILAFLNDSESALDGRPGPRLTPRGGDAACAIVATIVASCNGAGSYLRDVKRMGSTIFARDIEVASQS